MKFSQRRHVGGMPASVRTRNVLAFAIAEGHPPLAPFEREFAPRDYVAFLLNMDAEIEHGLMVQYLNAAYSLGGPQVPEEHRDQVRSWREILLGIAKEEMRHLTYAGTCASSSACLWAGWRTTNAPVTRRAIPAADRPGPRSRRRGASHGRAA